MSNRESFELSHGKPLSEISERPVGADAKELLDKLTSSETVSYFPEFNLLVATTELVPDGFDAPQTAIFNVFPSELAYEKLFHGFENVADIPYSGPVVDPIAFQPTFIDLTSGIAPTMSTSAAWLCSCPAATSSARSQSPSFSKSCRIVSASNPRSCPWRPSRI